MSPRRAQSRSKMPPGGLPETPPRPSRQQRPFVSLFSPSWGALGGSWGYLGASGRSCGLLGRSWWAPPGLLGALPRARNAPRSSKSTRNQQKHEKYRILQGFSWETSVFARFGTLVSQLKPRILRGFRNEFFVVVSSPGGSAKALPPCKCCWLFTWGKPFPHVNYPFSERSPM